MSMIPVQTSVPYSNLSRAAVEKRLNKANALAGLMGLGIVNAPYTPEGYTSGWGDTTPVYNVTATGAAGDGTSWTDILKQQTAGWGTVGQQILLNKNQPVVYQSGPGGTTVYGSVGAPVSAGTRTLGGMSTTTMLLIGGGVLALVLVMNRNR